MPRPSRHPRRSPGSTPLKIGTSRIQKTPGLDRDALRPPNLDRAALRPPADEESPLEATPPDGTWAMEQESLPRGTPAAVPAPPRAPVERLAFDRGAAPGESPIERPSGVGRMLPAEPPATPRISPGPQESAVSTRPLSTMDRHRMAHQRRTFEVSMPPKATLDEVSIAPGPGGDRPSRHSSPLRASEHARPPALPIATQLPAICAAVATPLLLMGVMLTHGAQPQEYAIDKLMGLPGKTRVDEGLMLLALKLNLGAFAMTSVGLLLDLTLPSRKGRVNYYLLVLGGACVVALASHLWLRL